MISCVNPTTRINVANVNYRTPCWNFFYLSCNITFLYPALGLKLCCNNAVLGLRINRLFRLMKGSRLGLIGSPQTYLLKFCNFWLQNVSTSVKNIRLRCYEYGCKMSRRLIENIQQVSRLQMCNAICESGLWHGWCLVKSTRYCFHEQGWKLSSCLNKTIWFCHAHGWKIKSCYKCWNALLNSTLWCGSRLVKNLFLPWKWLENIRDRKSVV